MSKTKQFFTAVSLVFVFMFFSFLPVLSAEVQAAYSKLPESLITAFNESNSDEKLTLLIGLNDTSTDRYQYMASRLSEPTVSVDANETLMLQTGGGSETIEALRAQQIDAMQNHIMQKRHIAEAIYLEANNVVAKELAESGAEIVYVSKYSPLVICKSTFSETIEMAKSDTVQLLKQSAKFDTTYMGVSTETVGLDDLYDILDDEQTEVDATGVKIGVLEIMLPDLTHPIFNDISKAKISCFDPAADYSNYDPWEIDLALAHASMVTAILINSTNGTAKNFEHLYCGVGTDEASNIASIEWMITNGVNVINNSTGVSFPPSFFEQNDLYNHELGYFAKWLDHIAYNHSVHYIAANGNYNPSETFLYSLTGMAYNVISVGNVDDNNTLYIGDDVINASSSYNNIPNTQYALKPDICAPGTNINIPGNDTFPFIDEDGILCNMDNQSGTSFSAPHVAGIVATLCSLYPDLLTKQALVKSILSASVSQKTQHRYDTSNVMGITNGYRQYGSGIVNAYNAQQLIEDGNYINTRISASTTSATHSIGTIQAGEKISVSLAFLKRVRFRTSTHDSTGSLSESDLPIINIHIRAASMPSHIMHLKSTQTNGGTVQKLVFTASTTDEYQIIVTKSDGDNTYETLYALSWLKDDTNLQ